MTRSRPEAEFQQKIIDLAKLCGWLVYHTYDSRRSEKGFPDLVLVRGPEIIFWEVKTEKGVLTPEQKVWLAALKAAGQEADVVRPSDFLVITERLQRHRRRHHLSVQTTRR